jgi:prepilin-type N-terminal cleavage/methylation domain-containing protein
MRRPRTSQRGFSYMELLAATAILSVGLTALVGLHRAAIDGLQRSEQQAAAAEIAAQQAESWALSPVEQLPACTGEVGCRIAGGSAFADPLSDADGTRCTRWVDTPPVVRADGSQAEEGSRYRVDLVVDAHPDPQNQPDARVITVSVCWLEGPRFVRQVQARRFVVPGV